MKIVFIPLAFLPRSNGGGAVAMYNAAKGLQSKGHSVSILTAENWESEPSANQAVRAAEDSWDGLPVRRLFYDRQNTGYPPPWFDTLNPAIERQVMAYLNEQKPDVVHVTCGQHLSASPIIAANKLGIPVVLTLIGFWYICPLTTLLKPDYSLCDGRKQGYECLGCLAPHSRVASIFRTMPPPLHTFASNVNLLTASLTRGNDALSLVRAVDHRNKVFADIFPRVTKVLAPSNALRDLFIKSGLVEPDRILYWQYSVDVKHAEPGAQKYPSEWLRLGYTGHMYRQKGVDVLIRAVLDLPRDLPVQLKLYGSLTEKDPEYGRELRELAARDERIQFFGRYENDQLGEVLRGIDVVVVPSLWIENSPVAIHEALAARTPVIASNLGGMADLVQHERNGLLFHRGDVNDLSEQIRRLVTDRTLFSRLVNQTQAVRGIEEDAVALQNLYESIRHG
jgi:glycosyltransferase involved in cell wall biosynthesis